jgi:uncharacterized protein YndB with AHSA1/START domain
MITKSVALPLSVPQAFTLFTAQISAWWPADRRHTDDAESTLHLEATGRFFERTRDGREVDLGRVLEWQAPERIVLDFYIATGPAHPTQVEVTFTPETDGTRVTVTHMPKPESEALWRERAPRYERSWEIVLAALQRTAPRGACVS